MKLEQLIEQLRLARLERPRAYRDSLMLRLAGHVQRLTNRQLRIIRRRLRIGPDDSIWSWVVGGPFAGRMSPADSDAQPRAGVGRGPSQRPPSQGVRRQAGPADSEGSIGDCGEGLP